MQPTIGISNYTHQVPAVLRPTPSHATGLRGIRSRTAPAPIVALVTACAGMVAGLPGCADAGTPAREAPFASEAPVVREVPFAHETPSASEAPFASEAPSAHEVPFARETPSAGAIPSVATRAVAAPSPSTTRDATLDAPWLVNVASARRETAPSLPCPQRVPEALDPPADATLELAWPASGVQIYACTQAKPSDTPAWTLEAPHAVLTSGKSVAAIHFAGPLWQGLDGSTVKGARLASAEAPDTGAVPWLLLSATPSGAGTFSHTTHIQRLETSGGKAPASGCDAAHLGAKALVPYRANYYFYRQASGGESIRQCSSAHVKAAKR